MKDDIEVTLAPEYLNRAQAARMLGMSPAWIKKSERSGNGPARFRCGKCVRYTPAALREWMQLRAVEV